MAGEGKGKTRRENERDGQHLLHVNVRQDGRRNKGMRVLARDEKRRGGGRPAVNMGSWGGVGTESTLGARHRYDRETAIQWYTF